MELTDKLNGEKEPNLRGYIIPFALIGAGSIGGAFFLSENGDDLAREIYNTTKEIFYFLLSDPY